MNTYGYVGGNPILWFDLLGLTQEQIDMVWEYARTQFPELDLPKKCKVEDLGTKANGDVVNGSTSIWAWPRSITLDDKYLADLNQFGMENLLRTILHEAIHYNEPRNQSWEDRNNHPYVNKAAEAMRDSARAHYYENVVKNAVPVTYSYNPW